MKFIELNKQLKSKLEPIYNINGEDFFLIKQAILNLKTFLIKDFEEFNYVVLDAEKLKKEQVFEQIETLPVMNEYRMVVINNPNQEIVKMLNKYESLDLSTIIVCVNAANLIVGEVIDCSTLDKVDLTKYILNTLAKFKLSIEEQALDYLIEATSGNMFKIVNELNKITAYCMDCEIVTIEIVTNLVANSTDYAIYMLTNAIDSKNYSAYQQILNDLLKSQSQAEIFSYMGKYFKRMQYIALNKNDDELSKILGIKSYAIQMSRKSITKNGVKYYLNLYDKYVNLDYKIKSGKITPANALYELIF
jgi:DNA polymerase III delta subunit